MQTMCHWVKPNSKTTLYYNVWNVKASKCSLVLGLCLCGQIKRFLQSNWSCLNPHYTLLSHKNKKVYWTIYCTLIIATWTCATNRLHSHSCWRLRSQKKKIQQCGTFPHSEWCYCVVCLSFRTWLPWNHQKCSFYFPDSPSAPDFIHSLHYSITAALSKQTTKSIFTFNAPGTSNVFVVPHGRLAQLEVCSGWTSFHTAGAFLYSPY